MSEDNHLLGPSTTEVSLTLQDKYDQYYSGQSEWRETGARDKADDVIALCRSISPRSILDVGAGEGAVLALTSDNSMALEINKQFSGS